MRWWLGDTATFTAAALTAAALTVPSAAETMPITRPLIESGGWSTVEQLPAAGAAPDACMIVQADSAVALRSIGHAVDLMVANAHWDLPRTMQRAILVTLGSGAESFPVTYTTRDTAAARIDPSALANLLDAMSHNGTMRVTLFRNMPVLVPLAGFAGALPAFRHCSGIT
jgi:hypothetical protein